MTVVLTEEDLETIAERLGIDTQNLIDEVKKLEAEKEQFGLMWYDLPSPAKKLFP